MALAFYGANNEFATATGGNVDADADASNFDGPPQRSQNLVISVKQGDSDPRPFEVGDHYHVSWSGGNTLENAVVVRSDAAPDQGGIIVFEGLDENGNRAQVIWTPGFDLVGWYDTNDQPGNAPRFYNQDIQPQYSHSFVCFAADTLIDTPTGPRKACDLRIGELVTSKDAGPVALRWVGQRSTAGTGADAPVVFEPGRFGNDRMLQLSQQHRILLRSPAVSLLFGLPEVLVPAKACVNGQSIRIIPCTALRYVHLLLQEHHILFANGAECESLYLGDTATTTLATNPGFAALQNSGRPQISHRRPARPILTMTEARFLMHAHQSEVAPVHYRNAG